MRTSLPLPLEGAGATAGAGVDTPPLTQQAKVALPPVLFHTRPGSTPVPALPPSRGKGSWQKRS